MTSRPAAERSACWTTVRLNAGACAPSATTRVVIANATITTRFMVSRTLHRRDAARKGPPLCGCNTRPRDAEQGDVVPRAAVERQVGEDFADDAAELEAVTGEAGGDRHV